MEASLESPINVTKRGHSIREVCASLGLSKPFVAREIRAGKLIARRFGRRRIILEEDLSRYLERANTQKPAGAR